MHLVITNNDNTQVLEIAVECQPVNMLSFSPTSVFFVFCIVLHFHEFSRRNEWQIVTGK